MIVGINCGHTVSGTVGSGAVGFLNESNETRRVGYKVMEYLRAKGVTVVDCTDDYSSTVSENLKKIVDKANAQPLDLFVSIHFNSGGGRGTEVYTYNGEVFKQAELVCENIEVCFVDTKSDADLYNEVGAARIAEAISDAIVGEKMEEELTMSQYEELKQMISEQTARVDVLQNEVYKIENPMIYNYIDDNMPDWAKEAVRWCVDNGIIVGTGSGLGLDDTKLWTCVVMYRLSKTLK